MMRAHRVQYLCLLRELVPPAPQLQRLAQAGAISSWDDVYSCVKASVQAACGAPGSQEERRWLLQREDALATRPCAHLGCINMAGSSEAEPKGRRCAGCATVRYCSAQCAGQDWPRHKPACKLMAPARSAGGAVGSG